MPSTTTTATTTTTTGQITPPLLQDGPPAKVMRLDNGASNNGASDYNDNIPLIRKITLQQLREKMHL
jgi:hypothetical protein